VIGYLTPNYPLVAAFRTLPKTRSRPADRVSRQIFKMAPKLSDYLPEEEIRASKGDLDRPISGLAMDRPSSAAPSASWPRRFPPPPPRA
jgi:UDP-N-acetylmuramoyl-L-alanyl-D-glutamate--2,6-diaminopimelate ligase